MATSFALDKTKAAIEEAWAARGTLNEQTQGPWRTAVEETLEALDQGVVRVATPHKEGWVVHEWLKKAILLSFSLTPCRVIDGGPWWDKVASKFEGWGETEFAAAGLRAVPRCVVRHSAYIGRGVVLMPSFVNMGAYVGDGTMVDTWATVGSCAQVGRHVHISGGAGIGGVLEPLQGRPVIIEDHCFIGARCEVVEGVRVGEGAVLGMGVFLGASTKIVERASGKILCGEVPPYSVVVPGTLPGATPQGPALGCAVIVKTVDAQTRAKTAPNELLR